MHRFVFVEGFLDGLFEGEGFLGGFFEGEGFLGGFEGEGFLGGDGADGGGVEYQQSSTHGCRDS